MPVLLLTGRPGVGKTTIIRAVAQRLADTRPAGFYTEEVRAGRARRGFRLVTFEGETAIMADVDFPPPRVGRYGVDVATIEQVVGPFELKTMTDEEIKKNGRPERHSVIMGLAMVRMTRDYDWPEFLKALAPVVETKAVRPGTFECVCPEFGPHPFTVLTPDARTLVLAVPGQPVVRINVDDPIEIGQEFFCWEVAVAVAGSVQGINAFNQPDVEASKVRTRELSAEF